jgi:hypothetical protein
MSMSEIARLRAQIEAEHQAAWNGLHGLAAGTARHDFINKKMEILGKSVEELRKVAGSEVAMRVVVEAMNKTIPLTLGELRRKHGLKRELLVVLTGLPPRTVYVAEIGGLVELSVAEKVLAALNRLSGQHYTLDKIKIVLKADDDISSRPTRPLTES